MQRLIFVGIVSLMALAGSGKAEMWCGYGSGTALDHPCQDDNSSIDAVLDEYKGEWAAICGVDEIGTVINQCGYFEEIDIIVTAPSEIQSIREKIPESVQGSPIAVVPPGTATGFGSGLSMSGANISLKGGERTASCHLTRKCRANSHGTRHSMDEDSRRYRCGDGSVYR
jgi:hypothetical protein